MYKDYISRTEKLYVWITLHYLSSDQLKLLNNIQTWYIKHIALVIQESSQSITLSIKVKMQVKQGTQIEGQHGIIVDSYEVGTNVRYTNQNIEVHV